MIKPVRSLKKIFEVKKCKFIIAMVRTEDKTDILMAFDKLESNDITKESISSKYGCNATSIIKEYIVSKKCAVELIKSMNLKNIFHVEVHQ